MHVISVCLHYGNIIWLPWQHPLTNWKIRYRSIICTKSDSYAENASQKDSHSTQIWKKLRHETLPFLSYCITDCIQTILHTFSPFSSNFSMFSNSCRFFAGRTIPSGSSNDPSVVPVDCSAANTVCSIRVCWCCWVSMTDSFAQIVLSETNTQST